MLVCLLYFTPNVYMYAFILRMHVCFIVSTKGIDGEVLDKIYLKMRVKNVTCSDCAHVVVLLAVAASWSTLLHSTERIVRQNSCCKLSECLLCCRYCGISILCANKHCFIYKGKAHKPILIGIDCTHG